MASPKRNVAYEFDIGLIDTADTGAFKASPTIAAGDFKVSTDNGALANLATLPVVSPAGSIILKINLSAAEMNGDKIMIQAIDAAGNEWDDVLIFIDATVVNVDDIVRSTTPANLLDVNATGEAGIDLDNTSGTLSAAQIAANAIGATQIADGAIDAATFAAGAINAAAIATDAITSAKIAANAITAAKIAVDAIGASELAADAIDEIRDSILSDSTPFAGADIAETLTDTADMQPKLGAPAVDVSADIAAVKAETALVVADTNELQTDDVPALIAALNDPTSAAIATAVFTTAMTEAYAAKGATITVAQALHLILALVSDFGALGTVLTARKLDGITAVGTWTLNDASDPSDRTRAT